MKLKKLSRKQTIIAAGLLCIVLVYAGIWFGSTRCAVSGCNNPRASSSIYCSTHQSVIEARAEVDEKLSNAKEQTSTSRSTGSSDNSRDTNSTVSLEYQNALSKAQSYLGLMHFSANGLKEQLEHDGFSGDASDYAIDHCAADWNEQAAGKAQDYLDLMSFSRSRLVEQLEYDGFTYEQAEYGAKSVGY